MITDLYKFNVDPESLRSELIGPTAARVKAELVKAIANDADGKIRQALIELGWTPPPAPSVDGSNKRRERSCDAGFDR